MKWFKHDSSARNSEKIAALEHRTGIEGYGFYFKMLEIVAGLMDENDRCEAKFSPTSWARQTNISTKKWLFLVQCCSEVGLIEVQSTADVVSVKIPKLLKRRDNYTKNLQVTKQVADKNVSLEVDKEEEKEEEEIKDTPVSAKRTPVGIDAWRESLGDELAIPENDPIFDYAEKTGISIDFLELSWKRFVEDMRERGTRKKDWRAHYRNAVRGNWFKLWWFDGEGVCRLTTTGEQARRAAA